MAKQRNFFVTCNLAGKVKERESQEKAEEAAERSKEMAVFEVTIKDGRVDVKKIKEGMLDMRSARNRVQREYIPGQTSRNRKKSVAQSTLIKR